MALHGSAVSQIPIDTKQITSYPKALAIRIGVTATNHAFCTIGLLHFELLQLRKYWSNLVLHMSESREISLEVYCIMQVAGTHRK